MTVEFGEPGWVNPVAQTAQTVFDAGGRLLEASGPGDPAGTVRRFVYDEMGRLIRVNRYDAGTETTTMLAEYHYDKASRLTESVAENGVVTVYTYDGGDRVTKVDHVVGVSSIGRMEYDWNNRGLVTARREYTGVPGSAATLDAGVAFTYDLRGRLLQETRTGSHAYDTVYTYDQLGNRLTMDESVSGVHRRTVYVYDTTDPEPGFPTRNNRLMRYEVYGPPSVGGGEGVPQTLERTVSYTYYATGHTSNITVKDGGDGVFRDLAFYYDGSGRLSVALWSEWEEVSGEVVDYTAVKAREFRFDADGRERYLSRAISASALLDDPPEVIPLGDAAWTDYDGGPAADFVLDDATETPKLTRRYFGDGSEEGFDPVTSVSQGRRWRHGDLIGTTFLETDDEGDPVGRRAYSAFGVALGPVAGAGDIESRYGYAGDWGYEEGLLTLEGASGTEPIVLLHVGERWYQPGADRMLGRDKYGINAGLNLYSYSRGNPVNRVDPDGNVLLVIGIGTAGAALGVSGWFGIKAWERNTRKSECEKQRIRTADMYETFCSYDKPFDPKRPSRIFNNTPANLERLCDLLEKQLQDFNSTCWDEGKAMSCAAARAMPGTTINPATTFWRHLVRPFIFW